MNLKFPITNPERQTAGRIESVAAARMRDSRFVVRRFLAFTLIEVMVAMALLSLIVIALMGVFNSTQTAFRASVTQTDVLESGRAALDLITTDLRAMSPSQGFYTNLSGNYGAVNFYVHDSGNPALRQPLTASNDARTNFQQDIFILSRGNLNGVPTWFGTGYAVYLSPSNLYSLYRFTTNYPMATIFQPASLFYTDFNNFLAAPNRYSHLLDGVVEFRVRAYDPYGTWLTNGYNNVLPAVTVPVKNALFYAPVWGEVGCSMYSNALPAAVEIEMATLEDRTLRRAESRPSDVPAPPLDARTVYLQDQSGSVHVFRQRVTIPNVDPSVYQ